MITDWPIYIREPFSTPKQPCPLITFPTHLFSRTPFLTHLTLSYNLWRRLCFDTPPASISRARRNGRLSARHASDGHRPPRCRRRRRAGVRERLHRRRLVRVETRSGLHCLGQGQAVRHRRHDLYVPNKARHQIHTVVDRQYCQCSIYVLS